MATEPLAATLRCSDCDAEISPDQARRRRPRCDDCEVAAALREFGYPEPAGSLGSELRPSEPPHRSWQLHLRLRSLRFECRIAFDDA
jgi:hypothetical protein